MGGAHSLPWVRRSLGPSLLKVIRAGSLVKAIDVLDTCPAAAAFCTLEGLSCLHVAAASRRADLVERLLLALREANAHRTPKAARRAMSKAINQKNVHGQTPLMLACRVGAADCVRLLLEAGADATLFDELHQRTCLHYAAVHGWAEAIHALLEDESTVTTADGRQQQLREALIPDTQGHHRYIDGREGCGLAALHLAASHGHLAAVKALLKWGASLTARCNSVLGVGSDDQWTPCSTPLHYAAARGRTRVVQALLQEAAERQRGQPHAPDVRLLQDWRGRRPYDVAAYFGHRTLLWVLNPRVPLAALLQQPAAAPAVPRLAALAATALRRALTSQLQAIEEARNLAVAAAAAATVGGAGGAAEGSRRGHGSRRGSRESSMHGARNFGPLARPSSGHVSTSLGTPSADATGHSMPAVVPGQQVYRQVGFGVVATAPSRHVRHASDGGGSGALHSFSPTGAARREANRVGGSLRGGSLYGSQYLGAPLQPQLSGGLLQVCGPGGASQPQASNGGALQPRLSGSVLHPQVSGGLLRQLSGGLASQLSGGPGGLADMAAAAASFVGCGASSVTSVSGCPVCLDSPLEVAVGPCGHGVCIECARHLVSEDCPASSATAPLCPLCRGVMAGITRL